MKSTTRVLGIALIAAGFAAAPASAAITATNVTSPAANAKFDPDASDTAATIPATVSGTATGGGAGDHVDIWCVTDNGTKVINRAASNSPLVSNVDASTGAYSTTVNQLRFFGAGCRLIAVPSGGTAPFNTAVFQGPAVYNSGHAIATIPTGPNAGTTVLAEQVSVTSQAQWGLLAGGACQASSASGFDPTTLTAYPLFSCLGLGQQGSTVDGQSVLSPPIQSASHINNPGLLGISNAQTALDLGTGIGHAGASSVPFALCLPDTLTCTSYGPAGIATQETVDGGDSNHTATVRDRYVNTSAVTKQLHLAYSVATTPPATNPGWRFPGDLGPGYTAHTTGQTITPPPSGTGSIFVEQTPAGTCVAVAETCGSATWSAPPQTISFASATAATLGYDRTIPPGCSAEIAFTYSLGNPQAAVNGVATAAESALASVPSAVSCPAPAAPPTAQVSPAKKGCKKKKKKHASVAKKKKCKKKKK
jgi:hypothetical protein